jgi:hypothetical protein
LTALLVVLITALSLFSCGAPKLDDVKDTFIELIEKSLEINEILFGEGLSVYEPLRFDEEREVYYAIYTTKDNGKLCAYYDKEAKVYRVLRFGEEGEGAVYSDKEKGIWLYKTDLEYSDTAPELAGETPPVGFRYVRFDERCTSVSEISAKAYEVYSEDYLRDVFSMLIGDEGSLAISGDLSAKYCETTVGYGSDAKKVLLRADAKTVAPIITSARSYDYDSIVILRNSRRKFVTIEIDSYGTYVDLESNTVKTGWSTISLSFIKENGVWKLDTPTY